MGSEMCIRDSLELIDAAYTAHIENEHRLIAEIGRSDAARLELLLERCLRCNNVKGDRTPQEMSWELRMIPRPPRGVQWTVRGTDRTDPCWEPYLALAA